MEDSELLKRIRGLLSKSQMQMAEYLDVSQSAIAKWELGERTPDQRITQKLRKMDDLIRAGHSPDSSTVHLVGMRAGSDSPLYVRDDDYYWAWQHFIATEQDLEPQLKAAMLLVGAVFTDRTAWVAVVSACELGEMIGLDTPSTHELLTRAQGAGFVQQMGNVPYVFKLVLPA